MPQFFWKKSLILGVVPPPPVVAEGVVTLGDVEFLSIKEFEGKLRTTDGPIVSTTGVGATITAAGGKEMYLAKAQAEVSLITGIAVEVGPVVLQLRFNAVVVDTKRVLPSMQAGEGGESSYLVDFEVGIGRSVIAGQVIDINVLTNNLNDSEISSSLEVWEEDTGVSPQITGQGSGVGGDTGFMSVKEFQGNVLEANGLVGGVGTITSIIPAIDKTFYLNDAKVDFVMATSILPFPEGRVELQFNTVIRDQFGTGLSGAGSGSAGVLNSGLHTAASGESLDGDGIIAVRLEVTVDTGTSGGITRFLGTLYGFITDTGTDPRVT